MWIQTSPISSFESFSRFFHTISLMWTFSWINARPDPWSIWPSKGSCSRSIADTCLDNEWSNYRSRPRFLFFHCRVTKSIVDKISVAEWLQISPALMLTLLYSKEHAKHHTEGRGRVLVSEFAVVKEKDLLYELHDFYLGESCMNLLISWLCPYGGIVIN